MSTVTLTRPAANAQGPVSTTRVSTLVVLEVPDVSDQTLREIARIAELCRGRITLLRPIDHLGWVQGLDDPLTESALRAVAQAYVRDVARRLEVCGLYASTKVTIGLGFEQAIEVSARECAASVIVVAHASGR